MPVQHRFLRSLLFLAALLAGGAAQAADAKLSALPATYIGDLPCADCAGIDWQLDLAADTGFQLLQTYRGKQPATTVRRTGRWQVDEPGTRLTLQPDGGEAIHLSILGQERLRLLDRDKRPIESRFNVELQRLPQALPARASGTLTALYRPQDQGAGLTLCAPGNPLLPLLAEGAAPDMEKAYGRASRQAGGAMLVRFSGHLAERPGKPLAVAAERFYGIWNTSACPAEAAVPATAAAAANAAAAPPALVGTTWRLVQLDGQAVPARQGPNAPHLILQSQGRVAGASGCNRLMGSYEAKGQQLHFSQIAGTMMACVRYMEEERNFLQILGWVQSWQINGQHLLLRDGSGKVVAAFLADGGLRNGKR